MTAVDTDLPNPIMRAFWTRSQDLIEGDLARLRALPPTFHPEEPSDMPDILPTGPGTWIVTRHADILHMSKNPRIYSSASGITVDDVPPEFTEFFSSMIAMDDPRHARLRKLVSAGFTPRMLAKLQGGVELLASQIVDEIQERGECDFVVDVAARLPLKVVCDLMGLPESELDFVFDQTNVILGSGDPEYVAETDDFFTKILEAGGGLSQLMLDVAASKQGSDSDDLTTMLVNAEVDGEKLSHQDIASFFILLVVAGNETTRNAISWGLRYLTDHPDQRAIWMADPDNVGPTAVEEIVRLASPVSYMRRTALEDTELDGQPIAAGDKLSMFYIAANRDEAVFVDPYRFDVRRDPNPHLGFGGPGPHFCLGAHLARREIQVMFDELFARVPDIHATSAPDPLASSFIHGVKHLQASFTPV
jgi:cytochrome P450